MFRLSSSFAFTYVPKICDVLIILLELLLGGYECLFQFIIFAGVLSEKVEMCLEFADFLGISPGTE